MKGFKDKSGKFRPTGNKTKSSLKKSDIRRKTSMPKMNPNDAGTYYAEKTDGSIIKMELTSKEATKIMKGFHNGIAKENDWKGVEVSGRYLEHMYNNQENGLGSFANRDKKSFNGFLEEEVERKVQAKINKHIMNNSAEKYYPTSDDYLEVEEENINALLNKKELTRRELNYLKAVVSVDRIGTPILDVY